MSTPGISGFKTTAEVDDAGTGAAPGGVSTKFDGLVDVSFPSVTANTMDGTEIDQADAFEKELPTGLLKVGKSQCTAKFTKANYQRIAGLVGKRGYTFKLTAPDDLTVSPGPTKLVTTFLGFISMIGEVKATKADGMVIPFELTVQSAGPVLS